MKYFITLCVLVFMLVASITANIYFGLNRTERSNDAYISGYQVAQEDSINDDIRYSRYSNIWWDGYRQAEKDMKYDSKLGVPSGESPFPIIGTYDGIILDGGGLQLPRNYALKVLVDEDNMLIIRLVKYPECDYSHSFPFDCNISNIYFMHWHFTGEAED